MDKNRRHLLSGLGLITAGAALIPTARAASTSGGPREGIRGKRFAMVIDLRKCVGCQACTVGCAIENQAPLGQFRTTVKQYQVSIPPTDITPGQVKAFMLPRLCNHCNDAPCIPVCPVQATYQRADGIVMVDNQRCVGCAYCVQACPYDARFINERTLTADKCTFCAHRLEAGLLPACVETCVGGARVIGDLNDPKSEINRLLKENAADIKVLKPEQKTAPHVFYIGMSEEFTSHVKGNPVAYAPQGETL
ncbi:tetrathionate reductase subunit B [Leminorella grimontii]|uniref:Tetrathionate reductase subunit B n=1 Tax=Leminorella grimontii TaxID=82981 RepID=A0AAV5MYT9_9GAMM|nr:4Fe-4S dicluster domain-containing protein [Leminorella grimontii]KFC96358.1 tetrathionate reductase subunit B [Leminorella grimontii ATCC 33999 = DSM 5078]GKX54453.1 tetrathionate reductase subunit B [Leminorella grimontii]VFS59233.1 Dimethylsulfide iron-sulfur subunit [Leminorella grimontii]